MVATSCGVVTMTAPVTFGASWMIERASSPVPGGRSTTRKSSGPQSTSDRNWEIALIFIGPRQMTGVLVSGRRNAMEMTARLPVTRTGSIMFPIVVSSMVLYAQHLRDIRAMDIKVHQACFEAVRRKRKRQVHRDRGLSDPPLPLSTRITCFTSIFDLSGRPFALPFALSQVAAVAQPSHS